MDNDKVKASVSNALQRFSQGDRLYVTDQEVSDSAIPRSLLEKITKEVFDEMSYNFLMYGDPEPKGVWVGSYDLGKAHDIITKGI